jgi:hypothetical protein
MHAPAHDSMRLCIAANVFIRDSRAQARGMVVADPSGPRRRPSYMENHPLPREKAAPAQPQADTLLAKKRQIQALKRVLIAKAEVRRLQSLLGRRRINAAS